MEENQEKQEVASEAPASASPTQATTDDVEKNKGMAILAYFLFFIPMLTDAKNSQFAMFHANQGLLVLLAGVIVSVVGSIIPLLGWFLILPFGSIFVFVLWIMGIINAAKGEMKELPLIGGIHILDKK
jgi:uncharacterized membrane protein